MILGQETILMLAEAVEIIFDTGKGWKTFNSSSGNVEFSRLDSRDIFDKVKRGKRFILRVNV